MPRSTFAFKTRLWLHAFLLAVFFLSANSWVRADDPVSPEPPELIVYTYDSMTAPGGLGREIFSLFEKRCRCRIKALAVGDGGQILSRLTLDKKRGKPTAHLVFGIDQFLWEQIKPFSQRPSQAPQGLERVSKNLRVDDAFVAYDYGVQALMVDRKFWDSTQRPALPQSLADLLKPEWKRSLILQDPRTSTPGLGFLALTHEVMRAPGEFENYWNALKPQWLTLVPGWDAAYSLFLKGEAPLVWSYTTSQAYHRKNGDPQGRYRALVFEDGNPVQVEGAALMSGNFKSEKQLKIAEDFLSFLLAPEVQKLIPEKNWMLPVIPETPLPPSFNDLPQPKKIIRPKWSAEKYREVLALWSRLVQGG